MEIRIGIICKNLSSKLSFCDGWLSYYYFYCYYLQLSGSSSSSPYWYGQNKFVIKCI